MDAWRRSWIMIVLAVCLGGLAIRASTESSGTLVELPDGSHPTLTSKAAAIGTIPQVRVLLGSVARPVWKLRIDGPYRLLAPDGWRVVGQGERLGETELSATNDGLRIGELKLRERRLKIEVATSGSLWVNQRRYRGQLSLVRQEDGRVSAINSLEVEPYVASVVNGEMPGEFPPAARQALAIAARTYVLYQMKARGAARDFDVYDNTRSQVYQGMEMIDAQGRRLAVETADSRRVAEDTRGIVLLYQGRLFCPYYGAVCGGHTGRGSDQFRDAAPPLVGVPCDGCRDAPRYRWQVETASEPIAARLSAYLERTGRAVGVIQSIEATNPADGRLGEVTVTGERGSAIVSTLTLREEGVGPRELPSPYFALSWRPPQVAIQGRGWGHCVGLCQWGARGKAIAGSDCAAILMHYYPGATLSVAQ
ncbi:MAG: SpoIID/LytB domain-containing protein [Planctomycetes bacterium]|nr:SpoIID/LytB domain-containing protein [Planctomycetota bacterium]